MNNENNEHLPDYLNVSDDDNKEEFNCLSKKQYSKKKRKSESHREHQNYHKKYKHHRHKSRSYSYSSSTSSKDRYHQSKKYKSRSRDSYRRDKYIHSKHKNKKSNSISSNNNSNFSLSQNSKPASSPSSSLEKFKEPNIRNKWSSPKKNPFDDIKTIKITKSGTKIIDPSSEIRKGLLSQKVEKEKPNFEPSGLLAMQTNSINGVVLKYTTPLDKGIPTNDWRLYQFRHKSSEPQIIHSLCGIDHFIIGKDIRISNIILNNQSSSRQHAVIQFKKKIINSSENTTNNKVESIIVPYIIDLESTNGTYLNNEKIESAKYYELKHEDVLNFGDNALDFVVILCNEDNSKI